MKDVFFYLNIGSFSPYSPKDLFCATWIVGWTLQLYRVPYSLLSYVVLKLNN